MALSKLQVQPIPQEFKLLLLGDTYTYSVDLTIPASTTVNFHIKTGSEKDTIITAAEASVFGAETLFQGFSDSTVTDNGTEIFPRNHNRQKPDDSDTRLFSSPTISDDGVLVAQDVAYAANQPGKIALADARILSNYILNKRSSNVFKITNRSSNTTTQVSIVLDYVEVEV